MSFPTLISGSELRLWDCCWSAGEAKIRIRRFVRDGLRPVGGGVLLLFRGELHFLRRVRLLAVEEVAESFATEHLAIRFSSS
mmetsp:Transcript_15412/g.20328  ORF Transcript_15412/g.20328 Transcript_15412/m.20328 type:complete len:82 (+) Transcript_15412:36-281(+)